MNSQVTFVQFLWFTYSQRLLNYLTFQSYNYDEGYSKNMSFILKLDVQQSPSYRASFILKLDVQQSPSYRASFILKLDVQQSPSYRASHSALKNWSYKRDDLSLRGTIQYYSLVHLKCVLIIGVTYDGRDLIRGGQLYLHFLYSQTGPD